jgi:signal recognition particle receptor subunit beta
LVLQGADGVVFVADSQWNQLQKNTESMGSLEEHLRQLGYDPKRIPLVIQYNKRDLPNIAPITVLEAQLGHNGIPHLESIATQGTGVFDTLKTIINTIMIRVQHELR